MHHFAFAALPQSFLQRGVQHIVVRAVRIEAADAGRGGSGHADKVETTVAFSPRGTFEAGMADGVVMSMAGEVAAVVRGRQGKHAFDEC